ncbi:MAG: GNAT family N-acetyltransferase [Beijerinckiaceae bacterium]
MSGDLSFRSGTLRDVDALVDLLVMSSWGGIREAWERVRAPGESWRQRGRIEVSDAGCELGYPRFVVAEIEGRIAGMMLLNLLGSQPIHDIDDTPPQQQGAFALMRQASDSLFVRELAVAPFARGRGVGREFLGLADTLARNNGRVPVTLIVNDANSPALKLYASCGYREKAVEPCIGHPTFADGTMLLLMEKREAAPSLRA